MKLLKYSPPSLAFWLSLAIALPAAAQQPPARVASHLPLWKLEGKTNSVYLLGSIMGLDPEQGVDLHYFRRARESGKEIVPLETVDYQIGLLAGLSKEEGELVVKSMLKDMANTPKSWGK
jgi:uncharacterized protein